MHLLAFVAAAVRTFRVGAATFARLPLFTLVLLVPLAPLAPLAQDRPAGPTFDGPRAFEHIRRLVATGPRPSGSPAIERARRYLAAEWSALGLPVTEQPFDAMTPVGRIPMVNLIATIPGDRAERILITGHYDTKRLPGVRFVGANDGGSSAAFLLEIARVLKARKHAFTYELVLFDGEEATIEWAGTDHTYGSRYYVDEARRTGRLASIRANILVDMIADRDLRIRRDDNSTPWLVDLIWSAARRSRFRDHFLEESTRIEDDHLPFLDAGIPSVDIIDLDYPAWHTADDTLEAVDAASLEAVGEVLLAALPAIESRLLSGRPPPAASASPSRPR
ncbi:MAG: M28 family peptidase [Vicinamibacterales bacterium]